MPRALLASFYIVYIFDLQKTVRCDTIAVRGAAAFRRQNGDFFMKSIFFFCTKLRMFWTLLPVSILLWLANKFNDDVEGFVKLYPLQIFLIGVIVFIFIFFFRVISVSNQEIRMHGLFSSRDRALINKGRSLKLTIRPKRRVKFELYSTEEEPPFEWMKAVEYLPQQICLFRASCVGGAGSVRQVLRFFGTPEDDIDMLLSRECTEGYKKKLKYTTVSSADNDDGLREILIFFDETVL